MGKWLLLVLAGVTPLSAQIPVMKLGLWTFTVGSWSATVTIANTYAISIKGLRIQPSGEVTSGFVGTVDGMNNVIIQWQGNDPSVPGTDQNPPTYYGTLSIDGSSMQGRYVNANGQTLGTWSAQTVTVIPWTAAQGPRQYGASTMQCSAVSLSGGYSYSLSGQIGQTSFLASGRMVFDGAGTISITDTVSSGGVVTHGRQYQGTYTLNPDCSGSIVLASAPAVSLDVVVSEQGKSIALIGSDQGTSISGSSVQQ